MLFAPLVYCFLILCVCVCVLLRSYVKVCPVNALYSLIKYANASSEESKTSDDHMGRFKQLVWILRIYSMQGVIINSIILIQSIYVNLQDDWVCSCVCCFCGTFFHVTCQFHLLISLNLPCHLWVPSTHFVNLCLFLCLSKYGSMAFCCWLELKHARKDEPVW